MPTEPSVVQNATFGTLASQGGPRINIDYRMQLIKQRESAAPFLAFMLHLNSKKTETYDFRGFETRPNPERATVDTGCSAGSAGATVQVVVASGKGTYFTVRDTVRFKNAVAGSASYTTFGVITAISTDTITIRPNDPAKAITAISAGDELQVVAPSFAQAALSANPSATVPTLKTFYTQIFKNAYRVSKTHANNRLYGAPERDRLRGETEIKHRVGINKALILGEGILDTTEDTANPRTTLTGIMSQLTSSTSNILSYGASLEASELFGFMTDVHQYRYAPDGNSMRRMVLCSADIMDAINQIALDTRQSVKIENVFGMDVSRLQWAGRTWDLVEDPVFSELLPGKAVVFHPRYVRLREFRSTRLEANIQPNNADYFEDQLLTELGLEVFLPELHGVIQP